MQMLTLARAFYGFLMVIHLWYFARLLRPGALLGAEWLWPAQWLYQLHEPLVGIAFLFVTSFFLHGACIFYPGLRWLKILAFAFLLQLAAAQFSYGKIDHYLHATVYVAFWMAWIRFDHKTLSGPWHANRFFFWAAQLSLMLTYALPGLWKIRKLASTVAMDGWDQINPMAVSLGWEIILQPHSEKYFFDLALQFPQTMMALWILVIAFEVGCAVIPWFPKIQRLWGCAILSFHAGVSVVMAIPFGPAAITTVMVLCAHPYVLRKRD